MQVIGRVVGNPSNVTNSGGQPGHRGHVDRDGACVLHPSEVGEQPPAISFPRVSIGEEKRHTTLHGGRA